MSKTFHCETSHMVENTFLSLIIRQRGICAKNKVHEQRRLETTDLNTGTLLQNDNCGQVKLTLGYTTQQNTCYRTEDQWHGHTYNRRDYSNNMHVTDNGRNTRPTHN